ncbi:Uncharacterised protein [Klebsiella pneumoniae]|nr:Uncharacterised protein [Klebsiella pneumoniae]
MHQSFNQRVHFYYCVLVALKMHGKSKKAGGIRGKNNFLLKWLRRAQDNNIFPPDITSEIEWLRGKIIQAGYDTDLEPMLDFVYATASRAEALKKRRIGSCARHGRRDVPCHVSIPGSANSAGAIQPRSIL